MNLGKLTATLAEAESVTASLESLALLNVGTELEFATSRAHQSAERITNNLRALANTHPGATRMSNLDDLRAAVVAADDACAMAVSAAAGDGDWERVKVARRAVSQTQSAYAVAASQAANAANPPTETELVAYLAGGAA